MSAARPHRAPLDPAFQPPIEAHRAYRAAAARSPEGGRLIVGLERQSGEVTRHELAVPSVNDPAYAAGMRLCERWVKFLVWSRGAATLHLAGDPGICDRLETAYCAGGQRTFDRDLMARVYGREFEVVRWGIDEEPAAGGAGARIGGHFDGCRIGFDLGASDYKIAAVIDGRPVFSDELPWDPKVEADPGYHLEHIRSGLRQAAAHLPRVDAIGGSAAGIYVDNRVKIASLFRAVPEGLFQESVEPMFVRLAEEWGVPFRVINDGDVTALAGALSLEARGVLGIAMGSSEAAGYLDTDGRIMGWLNELAFAPVDLNPAAPMDEWSGGLGLGALYFSQQAVDRLAPVAGFEFDAGMSVPDRLVNVQEKATAGDEGARKVFETIGTYLGYTIPWYCEFYDFEHVLILGRVTSGAGGEALVARAREVLTSEYPEIAERVNLQMPDEASRRVGQAVAAASLPEPGV